MIKIGITGNIACGKSIAFEVIKSAGYAIIDCDDIVKDLYKDNSYIEKVAEKFPVIITDEKIDLKKLSDLIFSDNDFKEKYESFIFPKVKEKILEFFEENKGFENVFVIVPLLFEAGFECLFDKIIFISADENIRRERLIVRNSILSNMVDKVIKTQIPEEDKIKKCDYIINNNATIEVFKSVIITFLNNICMEKI